MMWKISDTPVPCALENETRSESEDDSVYDTLAAGLEDATTATSVWGWVSVTGGMGGSGLHFSHCLFHYARMETNPLQSRL